MLKPTNAAAFVGIWLACTISTSAQTTVPTDFPAFLVPEHARDMQLLRSLYWLHYERARPLIPLWDEWLPDATLWPARGNGAERQVMRGRWAAALASRNIDNQGYVHTEQHGGPSHAQGWPFPGWHIAGGVGWHFRGTGIAGYDLPTVSSEHWTVTGGKGGEINDNGWVVDLTEPRATVLRPGFTIAAKNSPWLRLNWWANGLERANPYVEWTTTKHTEFSPERRAYFEPSTADLKHGETRTMIPVYRIPGWTGTITQFRFGFDNPGLATLVIKSFHTAPDTRHNINNLNFIRGVYDYFVWSRDIAFLRDQIGRVRKAMRFVEREFQTREKKCIYTTWSGHEGRSGVRYIDGKKQVIPGEGIGSNYWDLLPFGGEDALATIYYYDTLLDLAELEEQIANHPQWTIATGADAYNAADLRAHAREVKAYGQRRFWNDQTGRFGTVDLDGRMNDYGWTFLNNEAIYYDFASPRQAKQIRDWISGRRTVDGDTSSGDDIYHWRFGPRSSTRRNIDYYFWGWSNPEAIPFGYQVQDGGAVLGFSYHDLMSILKVEGPDAARVRLRGILDWFDETQRAGGYRAYYGADPTRGTMQGANVPGGLGIDREFFESVLVPQVMLYGFLGFKPNAHGFSINPRLPKDWPELTITKIHLHQHVLDITAKRDGAVTISGEGPKEEVLLVDAPERIKLSPAAGVSVKVRVSD